MLSKSVIVSLTLILKLISIQSYSQQKLYTVSRHYNHHDISMSISVPKPSNNLKFDLGKIAFSLIPLTPESAGRRKTLFKEIVKDKIWTLDQLQGVINVNVPVRSTIVKLDKGGLFINNPIAPTKECIDYVKELEKKHGDVKYIILSSLALEHKGTTGAFSSFFPKSKVYYQPGQYAFPINLPPFFFFPLGKSIKEIPRDSRDAPWGDEIDHEVLGPLLPPTGVGGFGETAFFIKSCQTLLVTDSIVKVEDEPPEIIQEDPRALLYHARDNQLEVVQDTKENRRKGWRRMVLFGLIFNPAGIEVLDLVEAVKLSKNVTKEMRLLGRGTIPIDEGLYPWRWAKSEIPNFRSLQGGLLVAPILQKLIFNRNPSMVINWANKVTKWPIKRIIPCHLANDIQIKSSQEFRQAFEFLEEPFNKPTTISSTNSKISSSSSSKNNKNKNSFFSFLFNNNNNIMKKNNRPMPLEEDLLVLNTASKLLVQSGVIGAEGALLPRSK